jgi:hypothetical protein
LVVLRGGTWGIISTVLIIAPGGPSVANEKDTSASKKDIIQKFGRKARPDDPVFDPDASKPVSLAPVYIAQGKKGLQRGNQLEEQVWNDFANSADSDDCGPGIPVERGHAFRREVQERLR